MGLQIRINTKTCMGSGNCAFWAPGVFELNDDGIATVLDANAAPLDKVRAAATGCPTGSINIDSDGESLHP